MTGFARGTIGWVSAPLVATAAVAWQGWWIPAAATTLVSAFMLFFHRDPERYPAGPGVISPADGLVMEASPERVAIFMNHHDVHVNRAPMDGRVKSVQREEGAHAPAFWNSAHKNAKKRTVIETGDGDIELCQISGFFARRIVLYVGPGDRVRRGERIGMIRFGSRVEFTLPKGYDLVVGEGDKVKAGETVVAVRSP